MRLLGSDYIIETMESLGISGTETINRSLGIFEREEFDKFRIKFILSYLFKEFIYENKEKINSLMRNSDIFHDNDYIEGHDHEVGVEVVDGIKIGLIPWVECNKNSFYCGWKSTHKKLLYATSWEVDGRNITSSSWNVSEFTNLDIDDAYITAIQGVIDDF